MAIRKRTNHKTMEDPQDVCVFPSESLRCEYLSSSISVTKTNWISTKFQIGKTRFNRSDSVRCNENSTWNLFFFCLLRKSPNLWKNNARLAWILNHRWIRHRLMFSLKQFREQISLLFLHHHRLAKMVQFHRLQIFTECGIQPFVELSSVYRNYSVVSM